MLELPFKPVEVFWDVTSCNVAVRYLEDGGNKVPRSVDILPPPQRYTVS
jgi:hypothetical protein